jgi:hypothetical protein
MEYFATASKTGRVRFNQISWTIGVGYSDGYPMPIGQANQVGRTADGLALWALRVKCADLPIGSSSSMGGLSRSVCAKVFTAYRADDIRQRQPCDLQRPDGLAAFES